MPEQATQLRVVSAEAGWDPAGTVSVHTADDPPAQVTLGSLGDAVRVVGPAEFPLTVLVQPVRTGQMTGIDASTVRVFSWDEQARRFRPVWTSGFNRRTQYVWAEIRRPGLYLAIGLPRDPVLRDMLRALARERSFTHSDSPEARRSIVERAFGPLFSRSPEELEQLRRTATLVEVQTGQSPEEEIRLGAGGRVLPYSLPSGATLEEIRERVGALEQQANGLPEEDLFSTPEDRGLHVAEPTMLASEPGAVAAVAAARGLEPFSSDWLMYHHDPQHTGVSSGPSDITATTAPRLRLRFALPMDGPIISTPSVSEGKVFVGTGNSAGAVSSSGGTLYRVDLESGAVEKTFTFNTPPFDEGHSGGSNQGYAGIACSPTISGGRVFFSGLDGKLYCLDSESFAPIWITDLRHGDPSHNQPVRHRVSAEGWCSPLVVNDRVYVGFGEGESGTFGFVYCLDAANGRVVWLFCTNQFIAGTDNQPNVIPRSAVAAPLLQGFRAQADPLARGVSVWSSCAYDPQLNRVYVGTGNSSPGDDNPLPDPLYGSGVLALDAGSGAFRGFFQPSPEDSYRSTDTDVDVPASPLLFTRDGARLLAVGSKNGSFVVLDCDTMAPVAKRQLLPHDRDGNPLPKVDPDPGENNWGVFGTAAIHPPTGRIFVGLGGYSGAIDSETTPFLRALDGRTLADVWATTGDNPPKYVLPVPPMYTTRGEAGLSSPAVVNNVVFIGTTKPALHAFSVETGLPLWSADALFNLPRRGYVLGPAIVGNRVVIGVAAGRFDAGALHVYSL